MTNKLHSDVYMQITHSRENKKAKVSFSGTIKKILVGSLIASAITLAVTPTAFAASLQDNVVDSTKNITQNYEQDINSQITNINTILDAIEKGIISEEALKKLAENLIALDKSVNASGTSAGKTIIEVVQRADQVVYTIDSNRYDITKVKAALTLIKTDLNIKDSINTDTISSTVKLSAAPKSFIDVKKGAWYYDNVMRLVNMGSISGFKDNGKDIFAPNSTITFGQFLTIAVKTVVKEVKPAPTGTHYATGVYQTAIEKRIINKNEFEGTAKALNATLSREDMSLILIRLSEYMQEEKVDTTGIKDMIKDYSTISTARQSYVLQAYSKGLVGGSAKGFLPKGNLTRAEAATVVVKLIDKSTRKPVKIGVLTDDVVIKTGIYAGRMTPEAATDYDLKALSSARFYKQNGKYYVSIDLPTLPKGFKWRMSVDAYTAKGEYVFATMNPKYTGLTGKQVVEVVSEYADKTLKDIYVAKIGVVIMNENNESMVQHDLSTRAPNQVLRQSSVSSSDAEWLPFSTKDIFKW